MPLGLSTRTSHPDDELTAALQDLAAGSTLVVEPLPVLETDDGTRDRRARAPTRSPSGVGSGATRAR